MTEPDFDLGADAYRRRIDVVIVDDTTVRCALQDDFHHFVVTVQHDQRVVVGVVADSIRWPWAACPSAATALQSLIGMPLSERFTAASRYANASHNCTHQFDAAAHAITHVVAVAQGRRVSDRRYDVEVSAILQAEAGQPKRNRLWVDGLSDLSWTMQPRALVDPQPPFDAAPWKGGFMRWADSELDPESAERAIVLRRACDIGMGRGMDLDAVPQAGELLNIMSGVCYTMQPDIAPGSARNVGNIRDFAAHPERLDPLSLERAGE